MTKRPETKKEGQRERGRREIEDYRSGKALPGVPVDEQNAPARVAVTVWSHAGDGGRYDIERSGEFVVINGMMIEQTQVQSVANALTRMAATRVPGADGNSTSDASDRNGSALDPVPPRTDGPLEDLPILDLNEFKESAPSNDGLVAAVDSAVVLDPEGPYKAVSGPGECWMVEGPTGRYGFMEQNAPRQNENHAKMFERGMNAAFTAGTVEALAASTIQSSKDGLVEEVGELVAATKILNALELAWGLIANGQAWDDRDGANEEWNDARNRWRDEHFHPILEAFAAATNPESNETGTDG